MNSHELQKRIQNGDRDAFRELYALCGQGVFLRAQQALSDPDAARDTVKQVFLNLHHEILGSNGPLDVDARLAALTDAEIRTRRILGGDFFAADDAKPSRISPAPESAPRPEPPVQPAPPTHPAPDPFANAEPYRPPLERAADYMHADPAAEALVSSRKARERKPRKAKKRGDTVITILIVIFLMLFLWVLAGILMDFEVLPRIDIGYRWFNETIFPLFNLEA